MAKRLTKSEESKLATQQDAHADSMMEEAETAVQKADAKRVGKQAEATVAQADKERILATRRDGELNRIAGDLPDDPKALWMFAEHSLTQSAISMIDAGRAFIKLKEMLQHGEFLKGLDERGISRMGASRICNTAVTFADRSEKFLKLGRTKLYACLEFSNDELDALEAGESVLDHDLDALDKMTTRELKALVQRRDSDLEIKDQLLESKNKQIDSIATEFEKAKGAIVAGDTHPSVAEIESEQAQILIPMIRLAARAKNMEVDAMNGKEPNRDEYFALQSALNVLRDQMAQAMDAIYNCGGTFQAAIAEASMPVDAEG